MLQIIIWKDTDWNRKENEIKTKKHSFVQNVPYTQFSFE